MIDKARIVAVGMASVMVLGAFGAVLGSAKAAAQDGEPMGPPRPMAPAAEQTSLADGANIVPERNVHPHHVRYENGFDIKLTDLFDRKAQDFDPPTVLLSAQWNYRFSTVTYLGLTLSGSPQPSKYTDTNRDTSVETESKFAAYFAGLNLAQGLYEDGPFRVVVGVSAGRGILFARKKENGVKGEARNVRFNFIEPALFVTFYRYHGVEMGAIGSIRQATILDESDIAKNEDISAPSLGFTFRTQMH